MGFSKSKMMAIYINFYTFHLFQNQINKALSGPFLVSRTGDVG